jgi:glycosyltransferase involved in cell wall biosynthesis
MKILVIAYACSPWQGSEPGVGWGFVAALAKRHDVWVIVEEEKFRADIERYLTENPRFSQSAHFYYLRKKRNRLLRKIWPPSYYWYYQRWHQDALELTQALHREIGFDLVHQLTMVGFREPGYLWRLGIPFVWGPIGGMGLFPWRFWKVVGGYAALYYLGYNLLNYLQCRFSSRPRLAARVAGVGLIAATPENQLGTEKYWGCSSTVIAEVGLPPVTSGIPTERVPGEALHIVWTGLHIPRKALNLALAALATLPQDLDWQLHVLGEGPRKSLWQGLAIDLGLAGRCHFHGWLSRDSALQMMAASHLMLITSLRDLTSTVTIEALAIGLPIVCLDHCGFAAVVDETCGIKIPVTTPSHVVAGFAAAIERLAVDEPLRVGLAKGAVLRAQAFSWERKAMLLEDIYLRKLVERGSDT